MDLLNEAFAVHEAMAGLPEHCREILDRFFARDESYQTIGEALGHPLRHDREQDLALPRAASRRPGGKKSAA